jgi:hypothetical protein
MSTPKVLKDDDLLPSAQPTHHRDSLSIIVDDYTEMNEIH